MTPPARVAAISTQGGMISLTHWGRVTHICVGKLTIIGSDNGLSPGRRQTIIWTNAGILLIWPLVTNFNEIPTEIYIFSFKKMHLKMSNGKWRPSCLGLNVLTMNGCREQCDMSKLELYQPILPGRCLELFKNILIDSLASIFCALWNFIGMNGNNLELTLVRVTA